ncbi:MAG: NAD-dependent epimerase/dehydratase family protein [Pseudonocardia sp.]|nr:NAD-dependent epimerase/dehydratase family protein [Pseudonocardia sp.]
MRVAVSGGAGFIGSHLVDALVAEGSDVMVIDDLSHGSASNIVGAAGTGASGSRVELVELDVRDGAGVHRALTRFRPEVVFHLAAQIDVRTSMLDPATDAAVNVLGSVNVFAAALAAGARRVVNTSTGGAIYGETDLVPTPETAPTDPLSAYGLGKHTVEQYGAWFRRSHGLDVVTLRYGNVYGPRQDPRGDAGVIAIFCDRVLSGSRPTVFGDGTQTRDYVFVGDIVAANLAAAGAVDLRHDLFNVGTGTEVDVLTLITAVADAAGVDPVAFAPEFRPARAGEVLRSCLDVSRARAERGLAAAPGLTAGLRPPREWVRTRPAAARPA